VSRTAWRLATAVSLTAVLGTGVAEAALPPQYQRQKELEAIIASGDILARLRSSPIDRIEYMDSDLYRVTAGPCSLEVRIVTDRQAAPPGPRRFHLQIGEASCR
jgi:hypothetical protein